jgi:uncharacterized HAD superfamily protein
MNIAVDFDSTCNQLDVAMCDTVNQKFGTCYSVDQWTSWGFWYEQPKEHAEFVWGDEVFMNDEWTLRIPPQQNCIPVLRRMMNAHNVWIISDRHEHHHETLTTWFGQHGLFPEIVITDRNLYPKTQAAQEREITLAIDDAPHNVLAYSEVIPMVYVYDSPWNRDLEPRNNIVRVHNWTEILQTIKL